VAVVEAPGVEAEDGEADGHGDAGVLYNVACCYSTLGEVEQGIECLEKSITSGMGQKEWIEHDADLDNLRSHPRFQALLKRLL
jgi:hypothetical protein